MFSASRRCVRVGAGAASADLSSNVADIEVTIVVARKFRRLQRGWRMSLREGRMEVSDSMGSEPGSYPHACAHMPLNATSMRLFLTRANTAPRRNFQFAGVV